MKKREKLPLPVQRHNFYYYKSSLEALKEELEEFLSGPGKHMSDKSLAEKFLGCQEIQANNSIEGYNDDAEVIEEVTKNVTHILMPEGRKEVIGNLYAGYQKILQGEEINKENLRDLYAVLSEGLLSSGDRAHMGDYYRNGPVYIYYSANLATIPDKGVDEEYVEEYMDALFEYINNGEKFDSFTDYYIKSQIMHFYFVYVHPYFDINGRTGRTLSMWYLLNNEAYPYVIFNRAISLSKNKYHKVIREAKIYHNATFFLNYMMDNVMTELEKEYLLNSIGESLGEELDARDYQTLYYILSMNGNLTALDFTNFYNLHNDRRRFRDVKESMIEPLMERGVLNFVRETGKTLSDGGHNYFFELNEDMMDNDPAKIKRLDIKSKH